MQPHLVVVEGAGKRQRTEVLAPAGAPAAQRIDAMWKMSFDAFMVIDEHRCFRRLNPAAAELLGATPEAILGARVDDFTPLPLLPRLEELWAELIREGWLEGTYEILRGDGRRSLVEFRAQTWFDTGQQVVAARHASSAATQDGHGTRRLLTPREREILQLAADGRSAQEIAGELSLRIGTVKTHFENVHAKLGVSNRAAAVAAALRLGLID